MSMTVAEPNVYFVGASEGASRGRWCYNAPNNGIKRAAPRIGVPPDLAWSVSHDERLTGNGSGGFCLSGIAPDKRIG